MRKIILAGIFLSLIFFWPQIALADGMVISPPYRRVYETGQKAVIWFEKGIETLILSTNFKGDAQDFGWIIPLPSKPEVEKGSDEIFTSLHDLTTPKYERMETSFGGLGLSEVGISEKAPVTVVETKKVDIYDISVVTSTESEALAQWFKKNDYPYPVSQAYILDEYIDNGWYFVAAKIDTAKLGQIIENQLKEGHATPLLIKFATDKIVYPMKISSVTGDFLANDIIYQQGFNLRVDMNSWQTNPGTQFFELKNKFEGVAAMKVAAGPVASQLGEITSSTRLNNLVVGKTYTFSAYLKGSGNNNLETGFLEITQDQNTPQISSQVKLSSQWQRLNLTFTATSPSTSLEITTYGVEENDSYFIDAVQVEIGSEATPYETKNINNSIKITQANVNVLLYIFDSKKKTEIPGFIANYAGWIRPKQIEKLAVNSQGDPLLTAKNRMYLTKLSRNLTPSQMTEDLYPRYADNNKSVGQGSSISLEPNKLLLVFTIPLLAEIIFIFWLFAKRKKANGIQTIKK